MEFSYFFLIRLKMATMYGSLLWLGETDWANGMWALLAQHSEPLVNSLSIELFYTWQPWPDLFWHNKPVRILNYLELLIIGPEILFRIKLHFISWNIVVNYLAHLAWKAIWVFLITWRPPSVILCQTTIHILIFSELIWSKLWWNGPWMISCPNCIWDLSRLDHHYHKAAVVFYICISKNFKPRICT